MRAFWPSNHDNLVVVWAASGVQLSEVWNEMSRREQLFDIAEKLPKRDVPTKGGATLGEPKIATLAVRRVRQRR
jgi:phosphoribosyl-ATP pyrophosphohydrolase